MTNIIITDTHFGVKNNSITWFNSQSDFIYKQLIPYIKSHQDTIRLIHMGDVFDSRSTISVYIAKKVRKMFKDLAEICEDVIVVAGNHDFYSPVSDEYDSLSLVLHNIDKVKLVRKESYFVDNQLFIPWYEWDKIDINAYNKIQNERVYYVFAHTNIVDVDPGIDEDIMVFSGHMHHPFFKGNRYNLGSCYSIDFSDCNSERGFYEFGSDEKLKFIPNTHSIRFWRLKNEDIFKENNFKEWDYIELYITQSNMTNEIYLKKINEYTKSYKNVWVIPMSNDNNIKDDVKFEGYDIESVINECIPKELEEKFNQITERLNGNI